MSDTVKAWIEERRAIHAGGRDVLLRSSYELERESGIEEGNDIDAIVDAHNMFPRALDALNAVLELHAESVMMRKIPLWQRETPEDHESFTYCTDCEDRWPCATVQAIEGAINE